MAKISANYEVVYILDPAQGEEAIAANVAKFQALAEQHGCSDVVVRNRGARAQSVWPTPSTTRPKATMC